MITPRQIKALASRIAEHFRPVKIILFGSYAYGTPREDSDLDLLIVMPVGGKAVIDKAVEIYRAMDALEVLPHAIDLMVRTPAQLRRRIAQNDFFTREIVEKGKILYEEDRSRMGEQSRGRLRRRPARTPRPQVTKL